MGQDHNILDQFIAVFIALFILSVITEKLGTFTRKYPVRVRITTIAASLLLAAISINTFYHEGTLKSILLAGFFIVTILVALSGFWYSSQKPPTNKMAFWALCYWLNPFKNTAKANTNRADNETKSKELTALSIVIGCIVALLLNASLFEMVKVGPAEMQWSFDFLSYSHSFPIFNPNLGFSWIQLHGILLTGFFLSFGSNFFHDLLDRLYAVKKYKQQLIKEEVADFPKDDDTVSRINQYSGHERNSLAVWACEELTDKTRSIEGVSSILYRPNNEKESGYDLIAHVDSTYIAGVDDSFSTKYDGRTYQFDVIIEEEEDVEICSNVGIGILNSLIDDNTGTLGCYVQVGNSKKKFFITCYHVVKHPADNWDDFRRSDPKKEVINRIGGQNALGRTMRGYRNAKYDVALVELTDQDHETENETVNRKHINGLRELNDADLEHDPEIEFYGNSSRKSKGRALDFAPKPISIKYGPGDYKSLSGLITIAKGEQGNWKPMAKKGDSGAVAFDKDGKLVGMLVATGKSKTYMMPIKGIFDFLTHKLNAEVKLK